jgi:Vacuolar protein sorting-associated protein 62
MLLTLPFSTVDLQQHYLGSQSVALASLSLASPTSFSSIFVTNTLQYVPTITSQSSSTQQQESSSLPAHCPDIFSYADEDPREVSSHDALPDVERLRGSRLAGQQPSSLAEYWFAIHQTAQIFVQWCKATLSVSINYRCEESLPHSEEDSPYYDDDHHPSWQYATAEGKINPDYFKNDENVLSQLPQYVLEYAPLVHLYSGEEYWPCDIREHLHHITPELNFTPVQSSEQHPQLDNLDALNRWEYGRNMFLTSNDNVEDHPEWLMGEKNIPADPAIPSHGSDQAFPFQAARQDTQGGRSDAPAVLVVVNKGHGVVDAFWFFFYSFNLGNVVVLRFGNHVGDWEHSVVRFHNGKPKAVFVSEHYFGQAYSYRAVEKIGKRPVIYSATGTHAMYATPGTHSYILPWGLLHDQTDKGPLWDPVLNSHMYTYDLHNDTLRSSNFTPTAPTEWFNFAGHWGDKQYPLTDSRQYLFAGNYHYVSGPLGPKFKNLERKKICQGKESERCVIKNWLGGSRLRRVQRPFEQEEMEEAERLEFLSDMRNS